MNDPNRGLGGSYVIDPATGERKLEERTKPQAAPAPADIGLEDETIKIEKPAAPAGRAKRK